MWLEAYKATLKQLENNTYSGFLIDCKKCQFTMKLRKLDKPIKFVYLRYCDYCPEKVHQSNKGCAFRYTSSHVINDYGSYKDNNLSIKYHKEAIKYLKSIKVYNEKYFMAKLKKIDKEIELNRD